MKKGLKFFLLVFGLCAVMGFITLMEVIDFDLFSKVFLFIKSPSSWFVGLSLAYAISNFFQKRIIRFFSKKKNVDEKTSEGNFEIFLVTLILTSLMTPFIKQLAVYFFTNFFIYFHVIMLQSMIILYLFFKLKNNYEISSKYFLTSEVIALIFTAIILYFVA
jgi:hypothetical protein